MKKFIPLLLALFFIIELEAQHLTANAIVSTLSTISETNAIPDDYFIPTDKKEEKKKKADFVYRHYKKLAATYIGYAIELKKSKTPLPKSHPLFEQFGNVFYDKLEGGGFSYCIIPEFSSKKTIKEYIQTVVIRKAPEAKLVYYDIGKRKIK